MELHENKTEFQELITLTAREKHIPESAVERDYYIVQALLFLSRSENADRCVFKGGTSLSKCYPGSIERFSEDIDLTYIPEDGMTNKQIERKLKAVEKAMTAGAETEIIPDERNDRNKSIWFWHGNRDSKIKLEIGSSVRPEPYGRKVLKTYIQEYLEIHGFEDVVDEYELTEISVNVLNIERTFVDKIMSVKRHSICGTIKTKARHIYDVTRLFQMPEIQAFLANNDKLKRLIVLTKQTDSVYLEKRNIPENYDPTGAFGFSKWRQDFMTAKDAYEHLHEDLLYTDEKQIFEDAIKTFEQIDAVLTAIGE
ncbi:MAG: nucleotidyl transferase AbiEii/AbiGii toxin family protein [Clostridia bacterium]|nr:nucleotidyl transferase AbiEii/AbiGii toxin family protein [Clostridia bacterium]